MPRQIAQTLAAFALLACAAAAHAFDLRVEVINAKSDQGKVLGAVYAAPEAWLKDGQAAQVGMDAAGPKSVLVYRNLPAGSYGVSVFHDENGNMQLDRNPAGIPIERYGFSRDAHGTMGPPAFADAMVDLQADTTITITLR